MLIDLNGMQFHLNIQNQERTAGFKAEIVDEAFNFGVQREHVHDLDGVAAFVKRYSGIAPRSEVLSQIAARLEELYRIKPIAGDVPLVIDRGVVAAR
ncbi:MAG: hypothetical protein AAF557_16055 [Pseudomonadota bacterium]